MQKSNFLIKSSSRDFNCVQLRSTRVRIQPGFLSCPVGENTRLDCRPSTRLWRRCSWIFSVLMIIRAFNHPVLLLFVSYNPVLSQHEAEDSFTSHHRVDPDLGWIQASVREPDHTRCESIAAGSLVLAPCRNTFLQLTRGLISVINESLMDQMWMCFSAVNQVTD